MPSQKSGRTLHLPNLTAMGLGNIDPTHALKKTVAPTAAFGKAAERSAGKDTTTGHWEISGVGLEKPFPVFLDGFPKAFMERFEAAIGTKTLGNVAASGTDIISELGDEHVKTRFPIVYTSADSVFQIAMHESVYPIERQYEICEIARKLLVGEFEVGRVIARPFTGDSGHYTRTSLRKDFSVNPPKTVLDAIVEQGKGVYKRWSEAPMKLDSNDRWHGTCAFEKAGRWEYLVEAWGDTFRSWKKTFAVRVAAKDPDVPIEAREGARLLKEAAARAKKAGANAAAPQMQECADLLTKVPAQDILEVLQSDEMQALMDQFPDRSLSTISETMQVIVERDRARFSAWYEFFPRGAEGRADKHSTFRDCLGRLDHAAHLGFDVIYFPPIHPIGITNFLEDDTRFSRPSSW